MVIGSRLQTVSDQLDHSWTISADNQLTTPVGGLPPSRWRRLSTRPSWWC